MTRIPGRIYGHLLGIPPEEATARRRGFRDAGSGAGPRLEQIGRTFLVGYHAALREDPPGALARRLDAVEGESRGFAYEGAAMGLSLLDQLTPWRRGRFRRFLNGPGAPHIYMMHVGAGWVLARLRRRLGRPPARLDRLLGWLTMDGYGFHEGYFHGRRHVERREPPARLSGYARRGFDQGLGRSLWFVEGADAARITATVAAFPRPRQADLWSGVGLACAYAGGVTGEAISALRSEAGPFRPQLAQGAAFAAKARQHAGNPAPHTELACRLLCELSAEAASEVTDEALADLPEDGEEPAFEVWRGRIQARLAGPVEVAP